MVRPQWLLDLCLQGLRHRKLSVSLILGTTLSKRSRILETSLPPPSTPYLSIQGDLQPQRISSVSFVYKD